MDPLLVPGSEYSARRVVEGQGQTLKRERLSTSSGQSEIKEGVSCFCSRAAKFCRSALKRRTERSSSDASPYDCKDCMTWIPLRSRLLSMCSHPITYREARLQSPFQRGVQLSLLEVSGLRIRIDSFAHGMCDSARDIGVEAIAGDPASGTARFADLSMRTNRTSRAFDAPTCAVPVALLQGPFQCCSLLRHFAVSRPKKDPQSCVDGRHDSARGIETGAIGRDPAA